MAKKGSSEPNFFGGYTNYDSDGHKTGRSEPGLFGGYTHYDENGHKTGRSDEGVFGDYTHYDSAGNKTGRSDEGLYGNYNNYDSDGNKTGSSEPGLFGGYTHTDSDACYIATCVYGDYNCPQVWTLRRFRDMRLRASAAGRAFVRVYYAVSPTLVRLFGERRWFKRLWRQVLDKKVKRLNAAGVEDTPYADAPRGAR